MSSYQVWHISDIPQEIWVYVAILIPVGIVVWYYAAKWYYRHAGDYR